MKNKRIIVLIVVIFIVISIIGAVFAINIVTIDFLQKNKEYINNPSTNKKVSDNKVKVDEAKAKSIFNSFIKEKAYLFSNDNEINNKADYCIELLQDDLKDIFYWEIKYDKYTGKINANTGDIISISCKQNTYPISKLTEEDVKHIAIEVYKNLNMNPNYKLYDLSPFDDSTWLVSFANYYNDIPNPYQCLKIAFNPTSKKIENLTVHYYDFENNEIVINKEKALELAKLVLKEKKNIAVEKEKDTSIQIKMANYFLNDNPDFYNYKQPNYIRNVWDISFDKDNMTIEVYIDATTGKAIGGDYRYEKI